MRSLAIDVGSPESVAEATQYLIAKYPALKVLINNAGVMHIDNAASAIDEDHQIDQDVNIALLRLRRQAVKVRHGSVLRSHIQEVRHIVAEVHQRRWMEGCYPDRIHAQILQVVEMSGNPIQVANAVAVCIGEATRVDFLDNRAPPACLRRVWAHATIRATSLPPQTRATMLSSSANGYWCPTAEELPSI